MGPKSYIETIFLNNMIMHVFMYIFLLYTSGEITQLAVKQSNIKKYPHKTRLNSTWCPVVYLVALDHDTRMSSSEHSQPS